MAEISPTLLVVKEPETSDAVRRQTQSQSFDEHIGFGRDNRYYIIQITKYDIIIIIIILYYIV